MENYRSIGYPIAGHIAIIKTETEQRKNDRYLSVSGAVFFNRPAGLVTESFQHLVVVTVLRQFIVTVHTQTGVDLCGDRSPSPLSPLVVLPLLPCWEPRSCHTSHRQTTAQKKKFLNQYNVVRFEKRFSLPWNKKFNRMIRSDRDSGSRKLALAKESRFRGLDRSEKESRTGR